MPQKISKRLLEIVDALPLKNKMRVLEIGCGPGVAAREIASRFKDIFVLAIDRSAIAIAQAEKNSIAEIEQGKLKFLHSKVEEFKLQKNEELYDIAFAIRVGSLDGRHPEIEEAAIQNIKKALKRNGKLFIDGGNPIKQLNLR